MTTEPPGTSDPTPAQEPGAMPAPAAPVSSPLSNMSGERLVMIAGIIVVGVYVIFGLILEEQFPPRETVIVSIFAIILPLIGAEPVGSRISTATLMTIAGYWLAVAGLLDFVVDIRFGWGGNVDVIASLLIAVSAVVAFLGARSIKAN